LDLQRINIAKLTEIIRQKTAEEGFLACGISPINPLKKDKAFLDRWFSKNYHGEMNYLRNTEEKRIDPRKLLTDASSVISVILAYKTPYKQGDNDILISKYAYGKDYHALIKKKLDKVISYVKVLLPDFVAEAYVDSAPVLEKRWAQLSGLGWRGKHTLLINAEAGTYFFLGEIVTNYELIYDKKVNNKCGSCRKCIDACPTGALVKPYTLDARKCIAYLTIESKTAFDENTPADFKKYVFGCDICQDACPFNQYSTMSLDRAKELNLKLLNMSASHWLKLTEKEFAELTKDSCMRRTGLEAIKRNIRHVLKYDFA
jgi:epoxyqueuosine reductase